MIIWIPRSNDWFIILHHSATKDSGTVSWDAIYNYHVNEMKCKDIGYHYGIEAIGSKCHCLTGRALGQEGGHTVGMNRKSIGICFVGNYDIDTPSDEMYNLGIKTIAGLCYTLKIDPFKNIKGHKEYAAKSCPGKNFDIGRIINGVSRII
jgi:N-acetylmuramoyl-L-alanine amidase